MTDITSATGASLAWTEYTPFGTIRASGATSQAPTNLFRFIGEYRDGTTGLYHLRARQYDPTAGAAGAETFVTGGLAGPVGVLQAAGGFQLVALYGPAHVAVGATAVGIGGATVASAFCQ